MKMKIRFLLILSVYILIMTADMKARHWVPMPAMQNLREGSFTLSAQMQIKTELPDGETVFLTNFVREILKDVKAEKGGQVLLMKAENRAGSTLDNTELQAYWLNVSPDTISIIAPTGMGVFYGLQTLRQMISEDGRIPCCTITDKPLYRHRGFLLDCSRHFWSKDFIKKQLDAMAYFKMNRFHFHLVDGGGWRLELDKYPELVEKTAYRSHWDWDKWIENGRQFRNKDEKDTSYGGYYTKDDIREIVEYAAERYITVIPEIEMPGHSNEVMAVYPDLSCIGESQDFRGFDLCVGNPDTFTFLTDVLTEVMELFPSPYIHVGGDEALMTFWKKCPKCMKLYHDRNFVDTIQIQGYLMTRIDSFLNSHGRRMLGWDEILEGNNLSENASIISWRGDKGGISAARMRHHAIMAPSKYCYLDKYQGNPKTEPKALGGYTPLDSAYNYNPMPSELSMTELASYIDGIQGNLWTEYIGTEEHAEYMMYPRLLAIAENGWGYKTSYSDFRKRVIRQIDILRKWGYNAFPIKERDR